MGSTLRRTEHGIATECEASEGSPLFLAELGQAVAPDAHGIVLMDKAGWHTAGDLVVPENLSLVFLPPYSPELNPIERLWLHLRDNRLSHCVFQTTGEIVDTCCDGSNSYSKLVARYPQDLLALHAAWEAAQ